MTAPFPHYVITRFSVKAGGGVSHYRDPVWLSDRLALLARLGAPSLRDQTDQDFKWLVFADIASPQWVRDGLAELSSGIPAVVFFVEPNDWKSALGEFLDHERSRGGPLITSRMDSDDLVHRDFVRVIRAAAQPEVVINLPTGYRLRTDDMRLFRVSNKRTCESMCTATSRHLFRFRHGRAAHELPSVDVATSVGMWVQTVHGGNIANASSHGYPVRRAPGFDVLSGTIVKPRLGGQARYRFLTARTFLQRCASAARRRVMPGPVREVGPSR